MEDIGIEDYQRLLNEICKQMTCSAAQMDKTIRKLAEAFADFSHSVEENIKLIAAVIAGDKGLPIRNIISADGNTELLERAYMEIINHYPETFWIGDDAIIFLEDTRRLKKRHKSSKVYSERYNNVKCKPVKGFVSRSAWNRTRSNPKLR